MPSYKGIREITSDNPYASSIYSSGKSINGPSPPPPESDYLVDENLELIITDDGESILVI